MSLVAWFPDGLARALWGLSVQVSVLIGIVVLASLLLRKAPPTFRYALWCVVLARLCIPVSLSVPFGLMQEVTGGGRWLAVRLQAPAASVAGRLPGEAGNRAAEPLAVTPAEVQNASVAATGSIASPVPHIDWRRSLPVGWALAVLAGMGLVLWRARRAARLVGRLPSVERPGIVSKLEALRTEMGIRRRVELRRADSVLGESGPMTLGILQPTVILPQIVAERWPLEEVEPVLKHELAHVRRLDLLVNWVQIVVQIVYFFHPLVWYANWRMRQERELICDDLAVGHVAGNRGLYCRSILRVLEETQGNPWAVASGIGLGERRGSLGRRIMRIMDHRYRGHRRLGSIGAATVVLLGAVCLALASDKPATTAEAPDAKTIETGRAVLARLSAWTDEETFTLADGQSVAMKVKPNVAAVSALRITAHIVEHGFVFDLQALDATGHALVERPTPSPAIHDGDTERVGVSLGARSDVFGKVQLSPRLEGEQATVEVKVLFARPPTEKEMEAAMLSKGREGQLMLAFRKIAVAVGRHKADFGTYPATLDQLKIEVPKDVFSPEGKDLHYEPGRSRFILSSCGEDGVYGNDDDRLFIVLPDSVRDGLRKELYPLPPDVGQAQNERLGPSGARPEGSCLLAGRVLDERTNKPVDHATVYLSYGDTNEPLFVSVSADGTFALKDVACGAASLTVINTAGYQNAAYNPEDRDGLFPRFTLAEGETRRDIVFKLKAAHHISGRVLDENGQPLREPGLWVIAMEQPYDPEAGSLFKQAFIRPDGTYMLDGLPAGSFLVSVQDFRAEQREAPYPVRYYPGTFSRSEAEIITFDQEPSRDNVDIRLSKKGGLAVNGLVADAATGAPIANALVVVQCPDVLSARVTTYTDASGRYHLEGLGSGEFLVQADARPQGFVRTKRPVTLSSQSTATIVDFALDRGVTITGTVVSEAGKPFSVGHRMSGKALIEGWSSAVSVITGTRNKYEPASVAGDRVLYYPGEGEDQACPMIFPSATTFLVTGMAPGKTLLKLRTGVADLGMARVTYQGRDVTSSGIETHAGDKLENVQIVVAEGVAEPDE